MLLSNHQLRPVIYTRFQNTTVGEDLTFHHPSPAAASEGKPPPRLQAFVENVLLAISNPRHLRRKLKPKGKLGRLNPTSMKALGIDEKQPSSVRPAGKTTSASRDVKQATSSATGSVVRVMSGGEAGSASGSGDGTCSGINTPELSPLEKRKLQLIDEFMTVVMRWLDLNFPPVNRCPSGNQSSSSGTSAGKGKDRGSIGGDSSDNDKENQRPRKSNKRQQRDDSPGGSGGGDDRQGEKGNKRVKKESGAAENKFACPFYQHDPSRCTKSKACASGFPTIHRMKEHLWRIHRTPIHRCPRCKNEYNNAEALNDHLLADKICEKSEAVLPYECLDEGQEAAIRALGKDRGGSQEQKWFEIYRIIFPHTPDDALPSPYFDPVASRHNPGLDRYIRRRLPSLARREIEKEIEKRMVELSNSISSAVEPMLERLTAILTADYMSRQAPKESARPLQGEAGETPVWEPEASTGPTRLYGDGEDFGGANGGWSASELTCEDILNEDFLKVGGLDGGVGVDFPF